MERPGWRPPAMSTVVWEGGRRSHPGEAEQSGRGWTECGRGGGGGGGVVWGRGDLTRLPRN